MSVLYMVRHGQASFGRENYDRLSKRGVEQARIVGDYFIRTGLRFDAVYSGAIERQRRTAVEIISLFNEKGVPMSELNVMKEFNEYDSKGIITSQILEILEDDWTLAGELEKIYTDRKSFQIIFEKAMMRWVTGKHDKPDVEHWAQVKQRVRSGLDRVMADNGRNKKLLIIASGGTISAAVQYALGVNDYETMKLCWQIVNSSITKFMYDDEKITLAGFNCTAHLEMLNDRDMLTYR